MAEVQELMDTPEEESDYLNIDWTSRVITVPSKIDNIGVYNDKDSNRLYFRCPVDYGDCKVADYGLYINYVNTGASGQEYDGDIYLVDDAKVEGDYITFSWLVGRRAYLEQGSTAFIVCCKIVDSDGIVQNELNTTILRLAVLEGLEIEVSEWEDEYPDIIEELLQKADEAITIANGVDAKATEALEKAEEALSVAGGGVFSGDQDSWGTQLLDINLKESISELYDGLAIFAWIEELTTDVTNLRIESLHNIIGSAQVYFNGAQINEQNTNAFAIHNQYVLFIYTDDHFIPVGLPETYCCVCETAKATVAKSITADGFILHEGVRVSAYFPEGNSVKSPTLNISGTGEYPIRGTNTTWGYGGYVTFVFSGEEFVIQEDLYAQEWIAELQASALTGVTVNGEDVPVENNKAEITVSGNTPTVDGETLIF